MTPKPFSMSIGKITQVIANLQQQVSISMSSYNPDPPYMIRWIRILARVGTKGLLMDPIEIINHSQYSRPPSFNSLEEGSLKNEVSLYGLRAGLLQYQMESNEVKHRWDLFVSSCTIFPENTLTNVLDLNYMEGFHSLTSLNYI